MEEWGSEQLGTLTAPEADAWDENPSAKLKKPSCGILEADSVHVAT